MLKKLRIQFISFTMILVFLLLCIIIGLIYGFTAKNLEAESLQTMHAVSGRPDHPGGKKPKIQESYLILQQNTQGDWIARGSDDYDLTDQAFLTSLLEAVSTQKSREGILKAYNLRYMQTNGPSRMYVFMDVSREQSLLANLLQTCVAVGTVALVLFFGLAVFLAKWALRPVEAAWDQQTQFVGDASHELKTPLSVILTNAELLQDTAYPEEARAQFSQNILTMALHMRHLIEGLLELARLDNVCPVLTPLDLSDLTEKALLPFEPVLFEESMVLESRILPGLWVKGSASHLQQVLEIFLDNARKYAEPGAVKVSLEKAGCHGLLQVETAGTPLTPQEALNIFQRFYRIDSARKRDGSYGLGLSIARQIVHRHGGKIWAESTPAGNRFCVLLPLCHRELPEKPVS